MTEIRIVFLDIDGTIFHRGQLMQSAVRAVQNLKARGIPVALCTGRSALHARHIERALGVDYAVYFNGSLVRAKEQFIFATPLAPDVARRVVDFCTRHRLPLILHTDAEAVVFDPIPEPFHPILEAYDYPPLVMKDRKAWEAERVPVFQFNVFMDRAWDTFVQTHFPECLLYRWDEQAVDLQKRGSDKSVGAAKLLDHLRIPPEHAVHIGDSGNDVGMFRTVGIAVAMGNAPESVKRCATFSTRAVDEDGVYWALRRLGVLT
ncbi:phosphatase [Alicyclobacillus cellulosilyticus]|uniref:Phosphatase n=1 Tax=Alicyclobacillus cellulosilyticus TaxID=1003997 RepID=A0A917KJ42_9BACL|nr:HAD family hydrolase [Alicyclobacillus cellulosilyticus]GGJ13370.1 phosphatase [Alicyclobacillus cellulosilyticus]